MPKQLEPTLTWEEAPDMITPKYLSKILGVCYKEAMRLFRTKDFPVLSDVTDKKIAYKYDVAEFLGVSIRNSGIKLNGSNEGMVEILKDILAELKRKNEIKANLISQL